MPYAWTSSPWVRPCPQPTELDSVGCPIQSSTQPGPPDGAVRPRKGLPLGGHHMRLPPIPHPRDPAAQTCPFRHPFTSLPPPHYTQSSGTSDAPPKNSREGPVCGTRAVQDCEPPLCSLDSRASETAALVMPGLPISPSAPPQPLPHRPTSPHVHVVGRHPHSYLTPIAPPPRAPLVAAVPAQGGRQLPKACALHPTLAPSA